MIQQTYLPQIVLERGKQRNVSYLASCKSVNLLKIISLVAINNATESKEEEEEDEEQLRLGKKEQG